MARDTVLLEKFNDGQPDPEDARIKTRWRFANGHWETHTHQVNWDHYLRSYTLRFETGGVVTVFRKQVGAAAPYEFVVTSNLFGKNDCICVGRLPDVLYLLRIFQEAVGSHLPPTTED